MLTTAYVKWARRAIYRFEFSFDEMFVKLFDQLVLQQTVPLSMELEWGGDRKIGLRR